MFKTFGRSALLALALLVAACGSESTEQDEVAISDSYWSSAPLGEAMTVKALRGSAEAGKSVVVKGRVKDFVDGRSVFTLIDESLTPCNEREDDNCPEPWDYCCDEPDEVAASCVTIEVREDGRPLKEGLKGFHDLDHLQHLTVEGKVEILSGDNVVIEVKKMHRM